MKAKVTALVSGTLRNKAHIEVDFDYPSLARISGLLNKPSRVNVGDRKGAILEFEGEALESLRAEAINRAVACAKAAADFKSWTVQDANMLHHNAAVVKDLATLIHVCSVAAFNRDSLVEVQLLPEE